MIKSINILKKIESKSRNKNVYLIVTILANIGYVLANIDIQYYPNIGINIIYEYFTNIETNTSYFYS